MSDRYDALEGKLHDLQAETQDVLDNMPDAVELVARAEAEHAAAVATESEAATDEQIMDDLDATVDDLADDTPPVDAGVLLHEKLRRAMAAQDAADREHEAVGLPGDAAPGDEKTREVVAKLATRMAALRVDEVGNDAATPLTEDGWTEQEELLGDALDADDEFV